jgi:predicted anti-sigma-YlaC factor YlaD
MVCEEIKLIIPAYIAHNATDDEISKVEEHLCICNTCREHLSAFMDRPVINLAQNQLADSSLTTPTQSEQKASDSPAKEGSHIFEYTILGLGIAVLIFFIFLLLKG